MIWLHVSLASCRCCAFVVQVIHTQFQTPVGAALSDAAFQSFSSLYLLAAALFSIFEQAVGEAF